MVEDSVEQAVDWAEEFGDWDGWQAAEAGQVVADRIQDLRKTLESLRKTTNPIFCFSSSPVYPSRIKTKSKLFSSKYLRLSWQIWSMRDKS